MYTGYIRVNNEFQEEVYMATLFNLKIVIVIVAQLYPLYAIVRFSFLYKSPRTILGLVVGII